MLMSIFWNPCLISVIVATLFIATFCNDRNDLGQKPTVHTIGHSTYLFFKGHFLLKFPLMSIYTQHTYLHIHHPFKDIHPHASSTNIFLTIFPITPFLIIIQQICWILAMISKQLAHLTIYPSMKKMCNHVHYLKFCHCEDFPSPASVRVVW